MKHVEQMTEATAAAVAPDTITSAEDAPETVLDLRRPDPEASVAAGELVQAARAPVPQRAVRLFVVLGRALVHEAELLRPTINIGRDARQDLAIDDPSVSREHCQICYRRGDYLLRDLGTSNGTTLNGRATITERLIPGDEIGVGRFVVIFCPTKRQLRKLECTVNSVLRPAAPAAATKYLNHDEIDSVRQAVSAEREAHLLFVDGKEQLGERLPLNGAETVLGKSPGADVPLRGALVAPRQASINLSNDRFLLRRYGRWRRVFVNGRSVNELELEDGDTIRIAGSTLRFFEPAR